ncbi:MAG: peptidylprolyl isomerase [Oscillospiraceae bacterium]|nr:peptidylprolyl isomerase [Ruminococcus sp.]MDE6707647.1 peptidylprolyl isomerase [Oscillospiraceae bacterium]
MKKLLVCLTGILVLLTGCSTENANSDENQTAQTSSAEDNHAGADNSVSDENVIIITLYPEIAPITCENFETLVSEGFYNGLTFHRVVDDFMAQGGDPQGTGMGGSENTIKGEFSSNGVENNLSHQRGVISMARSQMNDSASSQFFICYTDCSFLDGNYAAFGEVTQGMEVVDKFLEVPRSLGSDSAISSPNSPITMKEVTMIDPDENNNPRVQIIMDDFITE